jgi:DNA-directed RNA polymerase specialized sigma24 family protein
VAHPDQALIAGALARKPDACRTLIARLTPPIQRQVNAVLIRRRWGARSDVLDLTQEIFRVLLDEDGKVLRAWDPARGASLEGYVGMVAERRALSILASGRKSGHAEDPHEPGDFDAEEGGGPDPELAAMSRDALAQVLAGLKVRLSDKGYEMFRVLYVEERDVEWVMKTYAMNRDAVYAWRSRIQKTVREVGQKVLSDPDASPGRVKQGGAA